jgi:hypothetical protein
MNYYSITSNYSKLQGPLAVILSEAKRRVQCPALFLCTRQSTSGTGCGILVKTIDHILHFTQSLAILPVS